METVSQSRCFAGTQGVYRHQSDATGTPMTFAAYIPDHEAGAKLPVLWWLSGLTCTHENAMAQRWLSRSGGKARRDCNRPGHLAPRRRCPR